MEISEVAENSRTLSGCVKTCQMALDSDAKKKNKSTLSVYFISLWWSLRKICQSMCGFYILLNWSQVINANLYC